MNEYSLVRLCSTPWVLNEITQMLSRGLKPASAFPLYSPFLVRQWCCRFCTALCRVCPVFQDPRTTFMAYCPDHCSRHQVFSWRWLSCPYQSHPFSPYCQLSSWGKALTMPFPCSKSFSGSPLPAKFKLLMLLKVFLMRRQPPCLTFCPHSHSSAPLETALFPEWHPTPLHTCTLSALSQLTLTHLCSSRSHL